MKAIIIDDEEAARHTLESLIQQFVPELILVAQCVNVPDGVLAINKHNPDIVFLDIEMPGYSGFELLDFFREINFEIIFITAYSEYAIRAFEVSAIDYLLKPVEIDGIKQAVAKAGNKREQANIMKRLELMKDAYRGEDIRKLALPMSDGLLFVDIDEIVIFEADRAYTHIYLKNGSKITVSKSMGTFEEVLSNREFIFRPHRSFLINFNYLKKYLRGESTIQLENNRSVPLARDRKNEFEEMLRKLGLSLN